TPRAGTATTSARKGSANGSRNISAKPSARRSVRSARCRWRAMTEVYPTAPTKRTPPLRRTRRFQQMGTMGAMSDHLVRRRGLRFWLRSVVAAMLGFLLVGLATPAMAHTTLIDAGPGKGDEVATGTNLIALKFGEVVQTGGTLDVAVLDSNEDPVAVSDS